MGSCIRRKSFPGIDVHGFWYLWWRWIHVLPLLALTLALWLKMIISPVVSRNRTPYSVLADCCLAKNLTFLKSFIWLKYRHTWHTVFTKRSRHSSMNITFWHFFRSQETHYSFCFSFPDCIVIMDSNTICRLTLSTSNRQMSQGWTFVITVSAFTNYLNHLSKSRAVLIISAVSFSFDWSLLIKLPYLD